MFLNTPPATGVNLGILDCWRDVASTIELAEHADRLGFSRFWLTEHPPQPNPQMLAALVAGLTPRIRVGTAGILLHYHIPFQAAHQFLLLEHAFPGRIDAGFCAGGASGLAHTALLDGRPDPQAMGVFERRAAELIGFLREAVASRSEELPATAWPVRCGVPEIWSFGTGRRSAELAAKHGTAFGYSLFHHFSRDDTSSVELYRDQFRSTPGRPDPLVAIAVGGICAETAGEATALAAQNHNPFLVPTVVGTPTECRERIETISERYDTDDIVFLNISPDLPSRLRSIHLLAEAFGLPQADPIPGDTEVLAASASRQPAA